MRRLFFAIFAVLLFGLVSWAQTTGGAGNQNPSPAAPGAAATQARHSHKGPKRRHQRRHNRRARRHHRRHGAA